ncbi:DNA primase large subunit-like 2 [Homarus americanus]|uniref:DNA primase large subunit-like 2 n=1 Tax=Homarus americanus TaxID=6706 RepID=A0A8J5JU16_HOMAM|nr:DNA primase large subunit-like 2 [Homarus americanus]
MTFYMKPPEGNIQLNKLYQDAETRLFFLCQIHQCWGDIDQVRSIIVDHSSIRSNSDCLIEGSRKDRISHFVLRLTCLESGQLQTFFIEAETQLFEYRMECGGEQTVTHSVRELKRHSHFALRSMALTSSHQKFIIQVQKISDEILSSGMLECYGRQNCQHAIKVPWTVVESLVKERQVVVTAGDVEIHCHNLLQLLCCVFKATLEFGLKELSLSGAKNLIAIDARLRQVKKNLYRLYRKHQGGDYMVLSSNSLRSTDIESQVPNFPLCMQELHKILSSTGRLRHHARIRYTLYLKDIGLPVMENIAFWENFYSKPHKGHSGGCCHTWDGTDKNRYTYGIRHLYGIEGGRKNYTSHSCSALQDLQSQPSELGGCPFTSYGEDELSVLLYPILGDHLQLQEDVIKEVKAGRPNAACKTLSAFTIYMNKECRRKNHEEKKSLRGCDQDNIKNLEEDKNTEGCIPNLLDVKKRDNSSKLTLLPKLCEEQSRVSDLMGKKHIQTNQVLKSPKATVMLKILDMVLQTQKLLTTVILPLLKSHVLKM